MKSVDLIAPAHPPRPHLASEQFDSRVSAEALNPAIHLCGLARVLANRLKDDLAHVRRQALRAPAPRQQTKFGVLTSRVPTGGLAWRGEGERRFNLRCMCSRNAIPRANHDAASPGAGSSFAHIHSDVTRYSRRPMRSK
jgi:hypothetical protein